MERRTEIIDGAHNPPDRSAVPESAEIILDGKVCVYYKEGGDYFCFTKKEGTTNRVERMWLVEKGIFAMAGTEPF